MVTVFLARNLSKTYSVPMLSMALSARMRALSSKGWLEQYLDAPQAGPGGPTGLSKRQRRILFRSRQRGWLELDVLLGSWAAKHVPQMKDERTIEMVEEILALETPHLYKWIIGQEQPPPDLNNSVMKSIQTFAQGSELVEQRQNAGI